MYYNPDVPNTHFLLFDDVSEMVEETTKRLSPGLLGNMSAFTSPRFSGRQIKDWADVIKKSNETWDDGLRLYDRVMEQVRQEKIPPPKSLKRKPVWNYDEGDEFSFERAEKDQPFLRTMKRGHRPGPVSATIVCNVSCNSAVGADEIIYRGVSAIALTELMESAGYRIELWAGDLSTYAHPWGSFGKHNHFTAVRLKRTQDAIDANSLVISTSGWFFRTAFFAAEAVGDNQALNVSAGFGGAGPIGNMLEHITPDQQAIVCEDLNNHTQAVDWIRSQIENLK